jgi:hypothetical protein
MEMPMISARESVNIEEEYKNTLRTQPDEEMEVLLDTHHQDLISPILNNMNMVMMRRNRRRTSAQVELAMSDYFGANAEASEMCRQLLRNIKSTQSNYRSMDSFLPSMADGTVAGTSAVGEPVVVRSNPFRTTTRGSFRQIHDARQLANEHE